MDSDPFKAIVVGAGQIGALYDTPSSAFALSHCGAYYRNPAFQLAGIVDADPVRAKRAGDIWNVPVFQSIGAAMGSVKPDVVSVAVSTTKHLEAVSEIVAHRPRLIFLEKPIANEWDSVLVLSNLLKKNSVPCVVNYLRRFDPTLRDVRAKVQRGELGSFVSGAVHYAKGFRNNGSHAVDVIRFLLGPLESFTITGERSDYTPEDPSLAVHIKMKNGGTIALLPADERNYSVMEFHLFFANACVIIEQFGFVVRIRKVRNDPLFPGYRDLDHSVEMPSGLGNAMSQAVGEIAEFLRSGRPCESSFDEAMSTDSVVSQIAAAERYKPATIRQLGTAVNA